MKEEIINYLSSSGWNYDQDSALKTIQEHSQVLYINGKQVQSEPKSHNIKITYEGNCEVEDKSGIEIWTEWSIHYDNNDLIWIIVGSLKDFQEQLNELLKC